MSYIPCNTSSRTSNRARSDQELLTAIASCISKHCSLLQRTFQGNSNSNRNIQSAWKSLVLGWHVPLKHLAAKCRRIPRSCRRSLYHPFTYWSEFRIFPMPNDMLPRRSLRLFSKSRCHTVTKSRFAVSSGISSKENLWSNSGLRLDFTTAVLQ